MVRHLWQKNDVLSAVQHVCIFDFWVLGNGPRHFLHDVCKNAQPGMSVSFRLKFLSRTSSAGGGGRLKSVPPGR